MATVVALLLSQAIHVVGYHKNDTRITGMTHQLPFYYPLTSYGKAGKYGDLIPLLTDPEASSRAEGSRSFRYPRRPGRGARPRPASDARTS